MITLYLVKYIKMNHGNLLLVVFFFPVILINIRRDTAGEARMNSLVIFFHGPLHMDVPELPDLQEFIYIVDTGRNLEGLPRTMDDREGWGERERDRKIHTVNVT